MTVTEMGTERGAARRRAGAIGQGPLLLYDDRCGVCRRFVSMLIGADRTGTLRIAPLDCAVGDALRREHPKLEARDSAVWIRQDGTVTTHSDAILDAIDYLGGTLSPLSKLLRGIVPQLLRDRAYKAFADNRNLFGAIGMQQLDRRALDRTLGAASGESAVEPALATGS